MLDGNVIRMVSDRSHGFAGQEMENQPEHEHGPLASADSNEGKVSQAIADGLMVLPPDGGLPPLLRRRLQPEAPAAVAPPPPPPVAAPPASNVVKPAAFRSQATPLARTGQGPGPRTAPAAPPSPEDLDIAAPETDTTEADHELACAPNVAMQVDVPAPPEPSPDAAGKPAPQRPAPPDFDAIRAMLTARQAAPQREPSETRYAGEDVVQEQAKPEAQSQPSQPAPEQPAPQPAQQHGYAQHPHSQGYAPSHQNPYVQLTHYAMPGWGQPQPQAYVPPYGYAPPAPYPHPYAPQQVYIMPSPAPAYPAPGYPAPYGSYPPPAYAPQAPAQGPTPPGEQLMGSLMQYLPRPGSVWTEEDRQRWLEAAAIMFELAYGDLPPRSK